MTTLRKWRFPILIGSGLIAAAALVYFANGHFGADKTQGAIGKRDVYRDGQVASADVATPGSAPVATEAILESSEFKSLAKNPAFQQMLASSDFNELAKQNAFALLMLEPDFRALAADPAFSQLLNYEPFKKGITESFKHVGGHDEILSRISKERPEFAKFRDDARMKHMLKTESYARLFASEHLGNLLITRAFAAVINNAAFEHMAAHAQFLNALSDGSAARMVAFNHPE